MENGANSTLFIAKVRKTDTGNYTCSIGPNDFYTINVQVLNGKFYVFHFSVLVLVLDPRFSFHLLFNFGMKYKNIVTFQCFLFV